MNRVSSFINESRNDFSYALLPIPTPDQLFAPRGVYPENFADVYGVALFVMC